MEIYLIGLLVLAVIGFVLYRMKSGNKKAERREEKSDLEARRYPPRPTPDIPTRTAGDNINITRIDGGTPLDTSPGLSGGQATGQCTEALLIDGRTVVDGDWYAKLPRTRKLLIGVQTCPLAADREAVARERIQWDGARSGAGTGFLKLQVSKVGGITAARLGSSWATLAASIRGRDYGSGGMFKPENEDPSLVSYHVLPWQSLEGEIEVEVRIGTGAQDVPAELRIQYIPATQIVTGQASIDAVIPLGKVSRWDLAGRRPNNEVPLP